MKKAIYFFCLIPLFLFSEDVENKKTYDYLEHPGGIGNEPLIRLMITIMDPEDNPHAHVVQASFDDKPIKLMPPNPSNLRGELHAQVYPGTYTLEWSVEDKENHPLTKESYEQEIYIDAKDVWVDILVSGSEFEKR